MKKDDGHHKERVICIGASHAGTQFAVSLRQSGWEGEILLISEEPHLPYHRPPLSKAFMTNAKSFDDILIRPLEAYEKANIEMKLATHVEQISAENKTITLKNGETLGFDKLVLATGARVRKIPIVGADHDRVYYLRNLEDVERIKSEIRPENTALIIGGGYIGLETAASLQKSGVKVTVLEALDTILQRVTAPVMSDFFRRVHREEGVNIVESELAVHIVQDKNGLTVNTSEGHYFTADFIIVGIGVLPNIELAEAAGLTVENGIVVNAFCQSSNPDIYAIGDVTWHHNPLYDTHLRLESLPNTTEQAKTAAGHICGKVNIYNALPWFWSDQFDVKLQIAGLFQGYDNIVLRGDPDKGRQFSAFYFKGDRFLAVDAVNDPKSFMFSRMALTKGHRLDKTIMKDPDKDLKTCILN